MSAPSERAGPAWLDVEFGSSTAASVEYTIRYESIAETEARRRVLLAGGAL